MTAYEAYDLRDAALLDLPLIYGLIVEGSLKGVFNSSYGEGVGRVTLFKMLFRDLFSYPALVRGRYSCRQFYVFQHGEEDIGFVSIEYIPPSQGEVQYYIRECAILEQYRNQRRGGFLIKKILERTAGAKRIGALCTPNAQAMAASLMQNGFVLEGSLQIPDLLPLRHYVLTESSEEYSLTKTEDHSL